ncbi:ArsR family transcriptional regulator [Candidatus Thorarchaeota archaeon]|nr:MAG: ArsR family transcriptional regulator [Candidatus Thorarchaeota archaeon]
MLGNWYSMTMVSDERFAQLKASFVQTLEDLVRFRGSDPMVARIYAMIVLSPEPLTQEQIAKSTGYSRSQISRYLANLEERRMITKESMPGSRTQLYGGQTMPFLDSFRVALETAERFIKSRMDVIDHILDEWENLPRTVKETPEARKLKEVVSVFSAWLGSYQDLLSDFNQRFNERLKDLEKDLLLLKY